MYSLEISLYITVLYMTCTLQEYYNNDTFFLAWLDIYLYHTRLNFQIIFFQSKKIILHIVSGFQLGATGISGRDGSTDADSISVLVCPDNGNFRCVHVHFHIVEFAKSSCWIFLW